MRSITNYEVHRLNRVNVGIEAIDRVMNSAVMPNEGMGLAAAWLQLSILQDELRQDVSLACAPWFKVRP